MSRANTIPCVLVALVLACGGGETAATPSAPTPSPVPPAPSGPGEGPSPAATPPVVAPAPTEPAPAEPAPIAAPAGASEPGTNTPPAARLPPPSTPPEGADPVLGAIEPTPDAVTLGPEVTVGAVRFVLYTVDAGRVAGAALRARAHGADLEGVLNDVIDECAENGRERFACARRYAPDPVLAMTEYTSPTSIGIARVENGAVTARRSLVAAAMASPGLSLSAGDLDADGTEELVVEADVTFETENGMETDGEGATQASGTLVYFLDLELGTLFRFASRIESNLQGVFVDCRNDYELRDTSGDGRPDLHFERRCTDPDASEPPEPTPFECPSEGGRFRCAPVGTFFFDPASPYFAETLDELRVRQGETGGSFSEVEARVRRELAEPEE